MKKFIDRAQIKVSSGNGGPGCVAFRREKFVPKGGPDGGDGGKGGNVTFIADMRVKTLYDIKHHPIFKAKNGIPGMGKKRSGSDGDSITIKLPIGTLIKDKETNETIIDLNKDSMQFIAAKGGIGGRGNQHFATSTNQAPRYAQPGYQGEEREYLLELKIIADVGLVGLPNAGKSTLLKALSRANPKIAAYPFTTLIPNLGVVKLSEFETFIIADIPGIIEGASEGKGLGMDFLRHIERTRILILMVDFFSDDPEETEKILMNELSTYSKKLAEKPIIKVANKMDLNEAREKADSHPSYIKISGAAHIGLDELINKIRHELSQVDEGNE